MPLTPRNRKSLPSRNKKSSRSKARMDDDDDHSNHDDWCFVCRDGGILILCDNEGCTKAYHPSCVGKRLSSFKNKKQWTCSHHACSSCSNVITNGSDNSLSCLLCTYAMCASCKGTSCSDSEMALVKGKERQCLCKDCLGFVRLVEEGAEFGLDGKKLDYENKEASEFGFKECWEIIKSKEGLSFDDLYFPVSKQEAKLPRKSKSRKRKAKVEIIEDKDEDGSPKCNEKKPKLETDCGVALECDLQEKQDSEKEEEMFPKLIRRDEEEGRFAAIVASNIKLVYLRRSLVEEMISKQPQGWERKLVGSYVRLVRNEPEVYFEVLSSCQLAQVNGIIRNQENGEEILLHVLGEEVPISMLSDDGFSKEDCGDMQARVRHHIMRRTTMVEIEQKARELHEDITKDWIVRELLRLEKGIRHEMSKHGWISCQLDEYWDQRELLRQPSEQERLMKQVPQVIAEEILDVCAQRVIFPNNN